jgi:hypothetical protein
MIAFLISNFHRVVNVVYFLLSNYPASEFYTPTFWNTLSVPSSKADSILHTYLPMKVEQTGCSKTSTYKIQTPGNYPEESIQRNDSILQHTGHSPQSSWKIMQYQEEALWLFKREYMQPFCMTRATTMQPMLQSNSKAVSLEMFYPRTIQPRPVPNDFHPF